MHWHWKWGEFCCCLLVPCLKYNMFSFRLLAWSKGNFVLIRKVREYWNSPTCSSVAHDTNSMSLWESTLAHLSKIPLKCLDSWCNKFSSRNISWGNNCKHTRFIVAMWRVGNILECMMSDSYYTGRSFLSDLCTVISHVQGPVPVT